MNSKKLFYADEYAPSGKSLENLRQRIDVKLVADERKLQKLTANPLSETLFYNNNNVVGLSTK